MNRLLAPWVLALAPPAALAGQQSATITSTEGDAALTENVLFEALRTTARSLPAASATRSTASNPGALALVSTGFLSVDQDPEGDMPREVAFTPDGTAAVIVNRDTDTVTFFDVATRTITHTVAVDDFPVQVAVTPDGQYAVVPCVFGNSVAVIDIPSHTLAGSVPITGAEPYRVTVTPDSQRAVVGVINDAVSSSASVIDLGTLSETLSFPTVPQGVFGFFFTPESGIFGNLFGQIALTPDGNKLVVPDKFNGQVAIYDVGTGAQTALLATADQPTALDISSDSQLAVIEHEGGAMAVSTIDLVTETLTNSFVTGSNFSSRAIRVTPDKTHAIVGVLNEVVFVNLTTGATTATVNTGTVGDIEISFDGQFAFVSNFNARVISIASQAQVDQVTFAAGAEAAASPTEHRMVALNNRFREDINLYSTNGSSSFLEGGALSGEIEEGDAPRTLAVSSDGLTAVVVNNLSDNAAIVDLSTETVRAYVPTGLRSLGVAISPDGSTAVVANGNSDDVSIIDLTTDSLAVQLPVFTRPAEVLIAPDSQTAYVTTVAGSDRLHFIDLAGAASSVTGSIITGQMGSIGYTYGVLSGMAISPDGSLIAVCVSFDDELMIVDTATQTEIARVSVGDFPIRARFSPDGTRVYVTHSFGDSLGVVDLLPPVPLMIAEVTGIEFPLQVDIDAAGAFAYVGSFDFSNPAIKVVDTASNTVVATVPLTSTPRSSHLQGDELFVTLTDGELARIDALGAASGFSDSVLLTGSPSDFVYSASLGLGVAAQPGAVDGVDLVRTGPVTDNFCVASPHSGGGPAAMGASGSTSVGANDFVVEVSNAPVGQPGLFYYGSSAVQLPFGDGFRCAAGIVGRLYPFSSPDGSGFASRAVDFTQTPAGTPPTQILPGSTWYFQFWFRDQPAGNAGFNLSDGLSATFTP